MARRFYLAVRDPSRYEGTELDVPRETPFLRGIKAQSRPRAPFEIIVTSSSDVNDEMSWLFQLEGLSMFWVNNLSIGLHGLDKLYVFARPIVKVTTPVEISGVLLFSDAPMGAPIDQTRGISGSTEQTLSTTTSTETEVFRFKPRWDVHLMILLFNRGANSFTVELHKFIDEPDYSGGKTLETSATLDPGDVFEAYLDRPWNYSILLKYSSDIRYRLETKVIWKGEKPW